MPRPSTVVAVALLLACAARAEPAKSSSAFGIHIIDADTGRGVPLVSLTTTFKATYVSDSNGYVAFHEPGLMEGEDVWFAARSPGYEEPAGAFGVRGVAFKPRPGASAELKLKRTNIAERLYRLTGYGIYRDSVLLGHDVPIKEPLLNAHVTGQDTVQTAIYRGKHYWLWGDTDRAGFGLGCFSMTGATTALPEKLDASSGIDFTYFVEKPGGFARAMAHVPREGTKPIWLDGLVVTKDKSGRERMVGRYVAANSDFSPAETGLVVYADERECFERLVQFPGNGSATLAPSGRPFRVREGGKTYVCFVDGSRVQDTFEAATDPSAYEVFTCLREGGAEPDRDAAGRLRWRWQRHGAVLDSKKIDELVARKLITEDERPFQLRDAESGKPIQMASGSIAWNPYLKAWTLLFTQSHGTSVLGEVWFAKARSPVGPWRDARKVATHAMKHNDNSFYNPIQHEELAGEGGRLVYFEGTFVTTFSGNEHPTPYYDYNNLMYRIDLADPRLQLPEPPPGLTNVEPVMDAR